MLHATPEVITFHSSASLFNLEPPQLRGEYSVTGPRINWWELITVELSSLPIAENPSSSR